MILVILGTERYPFDRIVKEIDCLVKKRIIREKVFMQIGSCRYEPKYCTWERFLSFGEMCNQIENSDRIVAHAGAGTTLLCIKMGHKPIIVPRRKKYSEHVDDHQVSFSKKFETTGLVYVVYDLKGIPKYLRKTLKEKAPHNEHKSRKRLVNYLNNYLNSTNNCKNVCKTSQEI